MKTKKAKKCKIIHTAEQPSKQFKVWAEFAHELNREKSEGEIRQDTIRSAPISLLPMV